MARPRRREVSNDRPSSVCFDPGPSNLTKGAGTKLSAILFGNWADLMIGEWPVLELVANPFDDVGFAKGNVFVRAMQDIDIAVRPPQSFAAMLDVVTT